MLKGTSAVVSFCFLLTSTAAIIAGEPASGTFEGWGRLIDPDGDSSVSLDDQVLTIAVPAAAHDLSIELGRMNAPRVVRDVRGDFIAEVRVSAKLQPTEPTTIPDRTPYNGAGLVLFDSEKNYVRLERAAIDRNGHQYNYINFELRYEGESYSHARSVDLKGDWYLRLERHGDQVCAMLSSDGTRWGALEPFPMPVTMETVSQIGVTVASSSNTPFQADFHGFQLFTPTGLDAPVSAAAESDQETK